MNDRYNLCITLSSRYLSIYEVHRLQLVSKIFLGLFCLIYETNIPLSVENFFTEVLRIKVDEASPPSFGYHDIRIISNYYLNMSVLVLYEDINKGCPSNYIDVMLNYLRRQQKLTDLTLRNLRIEGLLDFLFQEDLSDYYNPPLVKLTRLHLTKVSIYSYKVFECLIKSCPELKNLTLEICMHLDLKRILLLLQLPHLEQLTIDSCPCSKTEVPLELSLLFGTRLNKLKIINCPRFTLCSRSENNNPTLLLAYSSSTNIKYCNLSNTAMVAMSLERLLIHSPVLNVLIAAFCRSLGDTLRVKAHSLEVLDLRATPLKQLSIATPSLKSLCLTLCIQLTDLSINSSILSVLDLKSLTSLSNLTIECPALKRLDLTGCRSIQSVCITDEGGFSSRFSHHASPTQSRYLHTRYLSANTTTITNEELLLSKISNLSCDQICEEIITDGVDGWSLLDMFDQIDRLLPELDYADFIHRCIGGSSLSIYQQEIITQYNNSTSIDTSHSSALTVRTIRVACKSSSSSSSSVKTPISATEKASYSQANFSTGGSDRRTTLHQPQQQLFVSSSDKKAKKNPRRRRSSL